MRTYTVTLENYEGRSKRVKVEAANEYDAMAAAQKNGWFPVDAK